MEKKSLYDPQVYEECTSRLQKVTEVSSAQWGNMDAAQMMAHCAEIMEVSNGKALKNTPFLAKLFKGFIKKMVIGDKPYPHNTKTHPQYLQNSPREFQQEKQRLLTALDKFYNMDKDKAANIKHSLFGTMSIEERGWSMYKHLDHHLSQFGA